MPPGRRLTASNAKRRAEVPIIPRTDGPAAPRDRSKNSTEYQVASLARLGDTEERLKLARNGAWPST